MRLRENLTRLFRLMKVGQRTTQLEEESRFLREQLDLLKSSLEVPAEWIDEFRIWKQEHPIAPTPLVTVCVATYNRVGLLMERSIPSILGQTYTNLEVVVVGDGCTDDTAARMAEIGDPRLRFIDLPQQGSYPADPVRRWMVAGTQAMNVGLAEARGDFVTHLDDDDEFLPDRLEKLVAFARDQEADLVWHPFWWEDENGNWRLKDATEFALKQVTTSAVFYRRWFTRITWDVGAHRLMEPGDWNRFRRIKYIGPKLARFPDPLLRHYRERSQMKQD